MGFGRERGRDAGRAGPDDERIAMSVALRVSVGIGEGRRAPEAGHGADLRLVKALPGRFRPHERLVVEAGGKERREHVVESAEVATERGPMVLALCLKAVTELDLGGAQIGGEARARSHRHEGIGFIGTRRHDAARAVIFERTSDEMHAVGEQGGSERVAGEAFVSLAVERKAQLPCPVDAPTFVEAKGSAHASCIPWRASWGSGSVGRSSPIL